MEDVNNNSKEVKPSLNFYMNSLEEQLRCEVRLTQTKHEGRVLLEIEENSLSNFLDKLQEQQEDNKRSEEQMQREIYSLKAQLKEAQTKPQTNVPSPKRELKNQEDLSKQISKKTEQQQTCSFREVQTRLELVNTERATIGSLEDIILDRDIKESMARSRDNQLERDLTTEKGKVLELQIKLRQMEAALLEQQLATKKTLESCQEKRAKFLLEKEHLHFQKEKISFREATASYLAQLEEQKQKNNNSCRASYAAKLVEEKLETNKLTDALKGAEQQL
ncbi:hypothetical protein L3Q82_020232 [Scortum barcoo]|uniref:Uncharacterized protein n=1 Tax=Scortum barcoo TaxID=214431 RepID=A0ACB8V7Q0_9TELE|nr:hypothetical protein L3Q82_020232 [Scortum barcoo]